MSFNDGFTKNSIAVPPNIPVSGNALIYNGTTWVAGDTSGLAAGVSSIATDSNLSASSSTGSVTISLQSSISVTNITASGEISSSTAQITTVSASTVSASTYVGLPVVPTVPGGNNTNIQFNNSGTLSGSDDLTFNYNTSLLSGTAAQFSTLTSSQITGTNGQFGTLSASFGHFSGNVLIYGTASLDSNPTAAYINYNSTEDRIVVFPGLDVSGSSTISGSIDLVSGELKLNGNPGNSGQVLVSQGTSSSPIWQSMSTGIVPAYMRFVDMSGSDTQGDGSISKPFKTIQKAIDHLGLPVNATDERNIRHVIVNGGIYNEDLVLPTAGAWKLIALGHVTLGNGDQANLASSVTRSVSWQNDQALEFSQIRPSITFTQAFGGLHAGSTQVAFNSVGWNITGDFTITSVGGAGGSTTTELNLHGVKIGGVLNASGKFGILNIWMQKVFLDSALSAINNSSAYLHYAKECKFDGLLNVGWLGQMTYCDIAAGATYSTWSNAILPVGFFGCQIAGTLTSGAGNYRADGTTQALSPTVVLAGGNTLTDLQ